MKFENLHSSARNLQRNLYQFRKQLRQQQQKWSNNKQITTAATTKTLKKAKENKKYAKHICIQNVYKNI